MLLYACKIRLDTDTFIGCVQDRDATMLYTLFQREISQIFLESLIKKETGDTLGIRLPVDFAIFYQIAQSTSGTESYSEGFTLIASILHKIVSRAVSERT